MTRSLWAIADEPRQDDDDWMTTAKDSLSLLHGAAKDTADSALTDLQYWWDELSDALFQDLEIDLAASLEIIRVVAPCLELLETPIGDEAEMAHELAELLNRLRVRRWGYGDGELIFVPNDISSLF